MQAGFYSTLDDEGAPGAMFSTNDNDTPLVIVPADYLKSAFLDQHPGRPPIIKPNAHLVQTLNAKGVSNSAIKKAFTTLSEVGRKPGKKQPLDCKACCHKFAAAAGLDTPPLPLRLSSRPAASAP